MALLGSFSLFLALGLSAYAFLAGAVGLYRHDAAGDRLAESARRAGIAVWVAVTVAAVALVAAVLGDDVQLNIDLDVVKQ